MKFCKHSLDKIAIGNLYFLNISFFISKISIVTTKFVKESLLKRLLAIRFYFLGLLC